MSVLIQLRGFSASSFPQHPAHDAASKARRIIEMKQPIFRPLRLGSVLPRGWLKTQLEIQRDGLCGHLDQVWPDVADSAWTGGLAEGWERFPYFLDGYIPLAYLLEDGQMIGKVKRWVDEILNRQREDGWLGPVKDNSEAYRQPLDPWPVFVALKALMQYADAEGDKDGRVVAAITRFLRRLDTLLDGQLLFDWGCFRWPDLAISIAWLYQRLLPAEEKWLLDLADKAYRQAFNWETWFRDFPRKTKQTRAEIYPESPPRGLNFNLAMDSHGVNIAMGIKQTTLRALLSSETEFTSASNVVQTSLANLDKFHGQCNGLFSCDEHLAGLHPSQGTELCTVVELMYSLSTCTAILGNLLLIDRLEQLAFNALPATISEDMWTHQYVQQANQIACKVINKDRIYTNNKKDANVFGLEPNYGCCTANMGQGWPKFASAGCWMEEVESGGLVGLSFVPCEVGWQTRSGANVSIRVETEYPFEETVRITLNCSQESTFPLKLRIPSWTQRASVTINNLSSPALPHLEPGTLFTLTQLWPAGNTLILLTLPSSPHIITRPQSAISIVSGPLTFAIPLKELWVPIDPINRSGKVTDKRVEKDFEVLPESDWNWAINASAGFRVERRKWEPGRTPFAKDGALVQLIGRGRKVKWTVEKEAAGLPPVDLQFEGVEEEVRLVPYGCARLRVAVVPCYQDQDQGARL